ncbi:MAG: hypothetical protein GOVbin3171_69 [Prokaryotic dsDNA virus sp.]|nr:MAG: hypothetical protein GOVbin3171_69 [Prokaryotic dsDNA virus sp.]|tara:strand:- start:12715 stop:13503 length:789 start_codon:yes stop_codon:yes gene_type:complete
MPTKLPKRLRPYTAGVNKPFGKMKGKGIQYRYLSSQFTPYEGGRLVNRPKGGGVISSNVFASGYQSYGSRSGNEPGSQYDIKNPMKGPEVRMNQRSGGNFSAVGGNRPYGGNRAFLKAGDKGAKATAKAYEVMEKGYAKAKFLDTKGDIKARNILSKIDENTSEKKKARLMKRAQKVDQRLDKRAQNVLNRKMNKAGKNKYRKKINAAGVDIQKMADFMYGKFAERQAKLTGKMNAPKTYMPRISKTTTTNNRRRKTTFDRS